MSADIALFIADPQDELDYEFDWSTWLSVGETITAFTINVPDGMTLGSGTLAPSESAGKITYWISGGTEGAAYNVTCHITTSASRQKDAVHRFRIVDYANTGTTSTPAGSSGDLDGGTP